MKEETKKIINDVCLECGKANDKKHKEVFGMWKGTCDMCGKTDVLVADAGHDFGIYRDETHRKLDAIQDRI